MQQLVQEYQRRIIEALADEEEAKFKQFMLRRPAASPKHLLLLQKLKEEREY